jgi:arylformamidase
MKLNFKIGEQDYTFSSTNYYDISIPLQFNGEQPNIYDVEEAESRAYEKDGFIGDTRRGGGCNFEKISMITHCNGTHTECIGHLTHKRYSIQQQLKDSLIPASLISISPEKASGHPDKYEPAKDALDWFISKQMLEEALVKHIAGFNKALIIRTIPNEHSKTKRRYMEKEPPYFSLEAMEFLVGLGVDHLLVDVPSVDRTFDEGKLNAHHIFWNIKAGTHEASSKAQLYKTITEMIFVPDEIVDGNYLLNLQIAPFVADAAPSRPLIYPLVIQEKLKN